VTGRIEGGIIEEPTSDRAAIDQTVVTFGDAVYERASFLALGDAIGAFGRSGLTPPV
jgi:hypothetical protein